LGVSANIFNIFKHNTNKSRVQKHADSRRKIILTENYSAVDTTFAFLRVKMFGDHTYARRVVVPHFEVRPVEPMDEDEEVQHQQQGLGQRQNELRGIQQGQDDNQQQVAAMDSDDDQPSTSNQASRFDDQPCTSRQSDLAQFYELGEPEEQRVRRFNTTAATYPLRFRNIDEAENFHDQLPAIFDQVVDQIMEDAQDNDYVGAEILHPELQRPVLIRFRRRHEIHGSELLHELERVMQSNDQLRLDDGQMQIKVVKVSPPQGKGQHKRQCTQLDKMRRLKNRLSGSRTRTIYVWPEQ